MFKTAVKKWCLFCLLLFGGSALLKAQSYELKVGDKIYDFEAYDAAGKKHKLSSFTGKYILIDFSSVHCVPCIAANDELRMLSK
jgi:cytochrome oxidase Cu insertion factor (SCO1/SenC/PrrC family)